MSYTILHGETFPIVEYHLKKGERIQAESDAMIAMDTTIDVEGKMSGGLLGGLARKFLTDESFFLQEMVAKRGDGKVLFAPSMPGGILDIKMDGTYELAVQKGGFLAATEGISIGTKVQNLVRGLFSGAGFFILKITGSGTVFVSAWGAAHILSLEEGEEVVIDNGHLIAWPTYMDYSIEKASGSWLSSFTSGEMLVCRFRGPSLVVIQTRNLGSFTSWIQAIARQIYGKKGD